MDFRDGRGELDPVERLIARGELGAAEDEAHVVALTRGARIRWQRERRSAGRLDAVDRDLEDVSAGRLHPEVDVDAVDTSERCAALAGAVAARGCCDDEEECEQGQRAQHGAGDDNRIIRRARALQ